MKQIFLQQIVEQWPLRAKRAKLRQKQLAALAGISAPHLSLIISGKAVNPKISTLNKIEEILISRGV